MAYIVIDLQNNVIDSQITTTNLLRKAFMVAKKLKLRDFENWISLELNGYKTKDDKIAECRKIHGELRGFNPGEGWIPTLFNGYVEMQDTVTKSTILQSVSELENLINGKNHTFCIAFGTDAERILGELFGFETKYKLFINIIQIQNILETVRTTVMNWALELECDGILGEEMIFTESEKQIAIEKNYTVNNFYGDVSHSQIQQHTKNSEQKK